MDHQLLLPHSLLPCAVSCSKLQFRAPSPWLQCAPPAVCSISSPCPSHLLLCLSQMCCPGLAGAGWQNLLPVPWAGSTFSLCPGQCRACSLCGRQTQPSLLLPAWNCQSQAVLVLQGSHPSRWGRVPEFSIQMGWDGL